MVNIDKFSLSIFAATSQMGRSTKYDLHTIQILFEEKGWKGTKICC